MEYEINYVDTFFYIGEFILQIGKECLAEKTPNCYECERRNLCRFLTRYEKYLSEHI